MEVLSSKRCLGDSPTKLRGQAQDLFKSRDMAGSPLHCTSRNRGCKDGGSSLGLVPKCVKSDVKFDCYKTAAWRREDIQFLDVIASAFCGSVQSITSPTILDGCLDYA